MEMDSAACSSGSDCTLPLTNCVLPCGRSGEAGGHGGLQHQQAAEVATQYRCHPILTLPKPALGLSTVICEPTWLPSSGIAQEQ